eukprot:jgi/Botrbrau1/11942/Bobra.341_1s0009.1
MKGAMGQLTQALHARFPTLEVVHSAYPVPPLRQLAAGLVLLLQLIAVAGLFFGPQLFSGLGMAPPPWYLRLRDSLGGALIAIWFGGNLVNNMLTSTGAFEVFFDGEPIWSKLQSGHMPSLQYVGDTIQARLQAAQ